ncbi:family 2A encapsulin nanocompartment cargo protein cysteine desulfurase [Thiocapsa rosea]|uniref:cysteine desulfurase n=1 Tax=Thiocapsa rosea TaxID=69360 RepID=A0A495VCN3_9GAMM|nr:family 2A encapsulin nanocompartment cargo protein cysteine desulfurase [Thiocapsa rosea]RKT47161.1 cysteine desulfurase /L-selenocysteine selenide-lyase (L-alanine-forming) [Thiocapsa rosea]
MTTHIPTSDRLAGLTGLIAGALPPQGLDEGLLDRLAAMATSALGATAEATFALPARVSGGPTAAQTAIPAGGGAEVPGFETVPVPSTAGAIAPADLTTGFVADTLYQLPPGAFTAQLPGRDQTGRSGTLPGLLIPRTYGLPEEDELRDRLAGVGRSPPRSTEAPQGRQQPSLFYFVDPHAAAPDERALGTLVGEAHPGFDIRAVRRDFPILNERVHGRPLIWFDNAATTQKPNAVIERLAEFYRHENSNIHRAAHELAARATEAYEDARRTVARFLGASSVDEIVFVRGTTEAINLVAKAWGPRHVGQGDEIVVSLLEHHANIVPWQQLAAQVDARLRVIPVDSSGQIRLDEYRKLLNDRTKLVAISQVSNALGTITPVPEIIELAHRVGARVLVDGAQSVAHLAVDVQALDADFFVFSGHKIFAPTGIGALYGKPEVLEAMEPWQGGGNMIADVTFERTLYQRPPARFEAGTPNIADAVGLAEALRYVERLGLANIARYEHDLLQYGTQLLQAVPGLHLIGTAREKASVLAFVLDGYSPAEVGEELNREGIAVRAGHHCAQPIVRHFGHEATVRPSLALYNTVDELDSLSRVLHRLAKGRRTLVTPGPERVQEFPKRRLFGE